MPQLFVGKANASFITESNSSLTLTLSIPSHKTTNSSLATPAILRKHLLVRSKAVSSPPALAYSYSNLSIGDRSNLETHILEVRSTQSDNQNSTDMRAFLMSISKADLAWGRTWSPHTSRTFSVASSIARRVSRSSMASAAEAASKNLVCHRTNLTPCRATNWVRCDA